jgi:hypothetical protein
MKDLFAFSVLCFLIMSISAGACSCLKPHADESLKYADIAFRGELVEHKGHFAVFRVDEWWKGNPERHVQFEWRDGTHGDCDGFWPQLLQVGSKMVVFGRKGGFRIYHANICLPQKLVDEADDYLKELGPGKPPRHD